ncbi:MAG: DUF106 domain-containing protein [Methanobacteriota archaeon]|nr:MAG: DUF106 domain-containing protein [Euryarchaeota archaeon]
MTKKGFLLAILLFIGLVGLDSGIAQTGKSYYIYSIAGSGSGTVTLNDSSDLNLDLALFTTSNIHIIEGILKTNHDPNTSEYLLDISEGPNGTQEQLTIPSRQDSLFLVVYSMETLMGRETFTEGEFSLQTQKAVTGVIGNNSHPLDDVHLHGNILKPRSNNKLDGSEYKKYNVDLGSNETINLLFNVEEGEMGIAIVNRSIALDEEDIRSVGRNITSPSEMKKKYPDILVYGKVEKEGSLFVDYFNQEVFKLKLSIIIFLVENSTDTDARYTLETTHTLAGDRNPSWYNRWVLDVVSEDSFWVRPPGSAIILVFVSMASSLVSAFLTRKLLDMEEMNRIRKQIQDHQKLKKRAMETADKKLWQKVQAKDNHINTLQQKMMLKQMLPQLVLFLPLIAIFTTLRLVMGDFSLNLTPDRGAIVAVLPFRIFPQTPLIGKWFSQYVEDPNLSAAGFGFWYFLSAIMSSAIIQRVLGINIQGNQPSR